MKRWFTLIGVLVLVGCGGTNEMVSTVDDTGQSRQKGITQDGAFLSEDSTWSAKDSETSSQCLANTQEGRRCLRKIVKTVYYCWQHGGAAKSKEAVKPASTDHNYQTGPRGGEYYINSKGKKVYKKKK